MKLYNTLTRNIEDFTPITDNTVSLYTCGPTVYNYAHIGNLRSFIFDDLLRRALSVNGYEVRHIMNITDVGHLVSDADEGEDKLEKGAQREGKTVWEVAEHYTDAFKRDVTALNILAPNAYTGRPDGYARATDFISEQIAMIDQLIKKGFAYQTEAAIYFDVSKLPSYGELSGQKLDQKEVAARSDVVSDAHKRNPQDFAVWFFTVDHFANHTMHWDSPWGDGFPGWHLECSAIIHATLGDPIDIHTGGIDHIGTHHPNEMAQTEGAFGHRLANFWLHNEFILIEGKKMSKSLGNVYTLQDITEKHFDPLAFRMLCLQAHYRSELNFSFSGLEAAQARLLGLKNFAALRWQTIDSSPWLTQALKIDDIKAYLANDLDTPGLLAYLSPILARAENELIANADKAYLQEVLQLLDDSLGFNLSNTPDIKANLKELLSARDDARDAKDWARSDALRDELSHDGIGVRDTPHGQIWFYLQ